MGIITARGGPLPSAAAMQAMFPDPFKRTNTWNLAPLNPLVQRYEIAIGDFYRPDLLPKYGAWVQDDWKINNRLTLNLGVRYDLIWNAFAQHRSFDKWMAADRPQDADKPGASGSGLPTR
jgi:outer membrane receptor protein involved in Fe transport